MTNPADHYEVADTRRHSDPAVLWVLVLAGSLLVHLLVILAMHLFLRQPADVQIEPAPISVEFFDADTEMFSTPPGQSVSPASSKATSAQISSSSNNQPSPKSSPVQEQILSESGNGDFQPSERSLTSQSPSTKASSSNSDTPSNSSPAKSESSPTSSPADKPPPSNTAAVPKTSSMGPVTSGILLPDLPSAPDPADNPGLDNQTTAPLAKPLSISQNSVPASFSAQVKRIASTSEPDAPDHPATIQGESSKTFSSDASGCLLTPAALRSFKQSVVLRVFLNENGDIDEQQPVRVQQPSDNSSYDQLAICAIKSWSFEPAYNLKNGSRLYKPSHLDVEIVATQ